MEDDLCSKFSVNTFVQTVNAALDPCAANQRQAEQSLVSFKAAPNSWLHINSILTETDDKKAHFIAMQLLEHTVKTRWNIFTDEHKESFKNYIIQQILLRSKETHKSEILEKFNIILVEILKRDWPRKWPSFIVDIINASQTSGMDVCTNSLLILKRLNDEIFIFTDVTTVRKRMLEAQLKQEFVHIFKLINNILEWSKTSETSKNLLNATFDTFESYCDLIPVNFLCETNIIENIFFYINRGYAVNVMKCLIKIVNKSNELENDTNFASSSYKGVFDQKVFVLHNELILFLVKTYNEYANAQLRDVYAIMSWEEKEFVTMTVTLLCAFYVNYKKYESENLANVKSGMRLITKISYVDDENIFYEIIGFWKAFAESIYNEYSTIMKSKNYGTPTSITTREKYKSILKGMIEASINKMPRPEEVYVTENEYGEIVKEKITETKEIEHYQNVKTTFFYLSYLNRDFTLELIKCKTNSLFEAEKFSYDFLNRISWSAGCMAGALDEKIESDFFVYILKELLSLCESRYTKDDKAVIASNIMFLIGSFDRFLLANHRFLKTVVKKLFEFMDETHEGIKDMACDTFLKISQKCSKIFATQMECDESYIVYIVKNLPSATSTLEFYQKRIVYEALCIMFTSLSERELLPHTNMLIKCFEWDITQHATKDQLNACCHYLRSYEIVFTNLPSIINYSSPFFMNIFENFARNISENSKYAKLVNDEIVRLMISVAKQSSKTNVDINLINNIYSRILSCFSAVQDSMYLILASEIVENFKTNDVQSRDAFMVNNLLVNITNMDQNNTELLNGYLTLILSLVNNSFDSSFAYMFNNIDFFDKVFSNIILGLTVDQSTNDLSLRILDNLVTNTFEKRLYMFYQRYALQIIENIIGIIVDKDQSYSFDLQCQVLAKTISNIKSNNMIRLSDTADNTNYASGYIYNILGSAFRNLTKESMELFIVGLFTMSSNCDILKEHVSDFKIKIYEYYSNEELNDEIALKEEREKRL